jgi:hypothetical protein
MLDASLGYTQFSTDGGKTWQNINQSLRIIFRDAEEDDDGMLDMNMNITTEGVILDMVDQKSGEVAKTACIPLETLVAHTQ